MLVRSPKQNTTNNKKKKKKLLFLSSGKKEWASYLTFKVVSLHEINHLNNDNLVITTSQTIRD